jgi:hypothetical protein
VTGISATPPPGRSECRGALPGEPWTRYPPRANHSRPPPGGPRDRGAACSGCGNRPRDSGDREPRRQRRGPRGPGGPRAGPVPIGHLERRSIMWSPWLCEVLAMRSGLLADREPLDVTLLIARASHNRVLQSSADPRMGRGGLSVSRKPQAWTPSRAWELALRPITDARPQSREALSEFATWLIQDRLLEASGSFNRQ